MNPDLIKDDRISVAELRRLLSYDQDTGELRWRPRGIPKFDGKWAGRKAGTLKGGHVQIAVTTDSGRKIFLAGARVAWALHYGEWPCGFLVDHEDTDGLNNRISNLRLPNPSQNTINRKLIEGVTSRFRGVSFFARKRRFAAQIKVAGRHTWLGLHDTEELAAKAYDAAAVELHGDFAVTNASLGLL